MANDNKKKNNTESEFAEFLRDNWLSIILGIVVFASIAFVFVYTFRQLKASNTDQSISIGDKYMQKGDFETAEKLYKNLQFDKEQGELAENRLVYLYTKWANSLMTEENQDEKVLEILEKLSEIDPDNLDALYAMASMSYDGGNTDEAIDYCNRIFALSPSEERTVQLYGNILVSMGKREEAKTFFAEQYEKTSYSLFDDLSKSLYPTAPTLNTEGGEFDDFFTLKLGYATGEYIKYADKPITSEDVVIYYTVDGSEPNPGAVFSTAKDQTQANTYEYENGIDLSFCFKGEPITVTAIAVDQYGMTSDPVTATYTFTKKYRPVTKLKINKTSLTIEEEEMVILTVSTLSPDNATNTNIVWMSSDTDFVTVDENGTVRAVKYTQNPDLEIRMLRTHNVYIYAKAMGSDDIIAKCSVTVKPSIMYPSTEYNSDKKYKTVDFTELLEINKDTAAYIQMDEFEGFPFLPDGAVMKNTEETDYSTHNFYGEEDRYGEIYLYGDQDLSGGLGRNTVICANYVDIDPSLWDFITPDDELNEDTEYTDGSNPLLTAVAEIDRHPSWFYDGRNQYIYLNTPTCAYVFQMFSYFHPTDDFTDYLKTDFKNTDEFIEVATACEKAGQLGNTTKAKIGSSTHMLTLVIYKDGKVDTVLCARAARAKAVVNGAELYK